MDRSALVDEGASDSSAANINPNRMHVRNILSGGGWDGVRRSDKSCCHGTL